MGFRNWLAGKISSTDSKLSSDSGVNWGPSADLKNQTPDPLVIYPASILGGQIVEANRLRTSNRYLLADQVYWKDERLYSAVELMAIMIQKSIGDVSIRTDIGESISNEEENAVKAAQKWVIDMEIPRLFYFYTIDLWKYGDAVDTVNFNGTNGITSLTPLPMHAVTAIDKLENIRKQPVTMMDKANYYIVDEANSLGSELPGRVIRKDRICHMSFAKRRSIVKDNFGRWTFNMWSMPPINSLIGIIEWKQQLIRNDILWRNRNVPREHHKLNLSEYDPSKYTGTHSQKIDAAKAGAQQAIEDYATVNQHREADQGFVTGMGVEIGFIEPKTASYADPMPIITQINDLLGGPTGTPAALMGGTSSGYSALAQSASFLALRAEIYSTTIQSPIEYLMKRHVRITHPGIDDEVVDRVFIKNRLILDKDRSELAKIVTILTGAKVFTPTEIRAIWGVDPLTMAQSEELLEWIQATGKQQAPFAGTSSDSVKADAIATNKDNQNSGSQSPAQRTRNEMARGQRMGQSKGNRVK